MLNNLNVLKGHSMNFTNGGYDTYFYDSSFAVKWVCLANLTTNLQAG